MDQRLVIVSRLFYERQQSKTDIAKGLGISITHVNRLLKEAAKRGIVRIIIDPPRFEGLEMELKERFGLRATSVVLASPDERTLQGELGISAAQYFEQNVENRQTVGVGSGKTLFEMVNALETKEREISIFPLCVCAEQDVTVESIDANTLVNMLWFKSGPHIATASRLELFFPDDPALQLGMKVQDLLQKTSVKRLIREISNLDNYFFSCSSVRQDSQLTKLRNLFGENRSGIREKEPIGDVVFNCIDQNGEFASTSIDDVLFRVSLETLRRVTSDRQKRVVLIAGGDSKVNVVRTALKAGLLNTLITDNLTAEKLLREDARGKEK